MREKGLVLSTAPCCPCFCQRSSDDRPRLLVAAAGGGGFGISTVALVLWISLLTLATLLILIAWHRHSLLIRHYLRSHLCRGCHTLLDCLEAGFRIPGGLGRSYKVAPILPI